MNKTIKKVAVLGSGVMGSRIACHFANIGVQVLLLDIVPFELTEEEQKKGLTQEHPAVRNRIVTAALQNTLKSNPSAIYDKTFASRITTGNFDDDLSKIKDYDWIIEVVVERLDIKQQLFEKVEKFRKPGTLITSNTSGIPMHMMCEGRSEDFQKNFAGTHFFNPPRYLRLLEIIPGPKTDPEIVDFLMDYGDRFLGKETVLCKDTPAFIANRIGVYAIISGMHTIEKMGFGVSEIDKMTGPVIGRAKSATFRTMDVVGLDTTVNVANNLYKALPHDESRDKFKLPKIMEVLYNNKWFGDKTGQGYFKMIRHKDGSKELKELDFETFEYKDVEKPKIKALEAAKDIEDMKKRIKFLMNFDDKAGEFYRASFYDLFKYCSHRIPEISDELYRIDQAVCAGFGWELGPFETWDILGVKETVEKMEAAGEKAADWIHEMLKAGNESFYKVENGKKLYYDIPSKSYVEIPGIEDFILLDTLKASGKKLWGNAGASVYDMGDDVIGLEFHTKMNSLGAEVIEGINTAIGMAEKSHKGLVIGNEGGNFSAGANLAMLFMFAGDQEFDEINLMIAQFQNTMMRARYSSVPVVVAPHNMALGGGCELSLHADHIQAHAELYMGLVEVGVGLIPAGGGTKEMTKRFANTVKDGDVELNLLQEYFMNIAMAKVSTSAAEAKNLGYLRNQDGITLNRKRQLAEAKAKVLELHEAGYTQPVQQSNIRVLGKTSLALFEAGITGMRYGAYISEHDAKIARKLAWVMSGGDLSSPTEVSEQYLLDLEREAFLSLTGEKKTLERIHSILFKGKPLRN
ncbi:MULTISPECIES: 3-hydroxyacyl-CoA dehydrogenase/enoyl-CoA hydratase family protein [Algoriphagus]|jgi:3-hydroxyacyl-CoA dehydrogenase|uniref:3-hydroxyacyl-CoA dehydrogenase/enoyl-CoA hydratase family protein n=3 Tax=Cyclobacteriaceae TaxID=563798 RepID=UPI000C38E02B|nr:MULTISPECIES: 3-hydroxyacyl-CoA dehydrogenase/enoyl-CoA hydratase family protein [Algoriphagus]MAL12110.1 3-hydroxyacyl-CoA dehydrogenase [Algoriphagus sp.]QYH40497.1 3-hydroxyacyl-CoA dehydrogenase/enoyl-CoA hydratase family protein [Algoriphagus sp. NBT04N3]HCB46029.1 3-hydroxyacyl-CoA dehydrogenase [Algoriphagus sp.]HCH44801.1 3-hydroxyacyl-CoA dehydrogenase [Algoriphagus sp.]|tara:strand:- start:1174 stop:3579 length:2406 start_codon:yes stop_codon:yes gene_type:complete